MPTPTDLIPFDMAAQKGEQLISAAAAVPASSAAFAALAEV